MEKYESLEETLEGRNAFSKKVEEAFSSLPAETWAPLKRPAGSFPVKVDSKDSREARTAIVYEVRDSIEQDNLSGGIFRDENGVYLSNGREYSNGKTGFYMFFSRRIGNSYRNIAFADYRTKKVVFGSSEIESMSSKQLSRFAYAINQYLSGNRGKTES